MCDSICNCCCLLLHNGNLPLLNFPRNPSYSALPCFSRLLPTPKHATSTATALHSTPNSDAIPFASDHRHRRLIFGNQSSSSYSRHCKLVKHFDSDLGRQMVRRTSIMAKQIISIRSALRLGFVSQLWVDTASWAVVVVEVRPHLLSGEFERFLLKDIIRVGDVVLVENEKVMEGDVKLVGLDTLRWNCLQHQEGSFYPAHVGHTVVTPGGQRIGKVRGYTFNINCGAVESLELDPFGIGVIPSSLVSMYAVYVEDVIEVLSEMVVVGADAISHMQRLTKGLWDGQRRINEFEEEFDKWKGRAR